MSGLRWVQADGLRPAGWWDGDPWRDPAPVGPHLRPAEAERLVPFSAYGRRTRPTPCEACHGVVTEYDDGTVWCRKCGDLGEVPTPTPTPTTNNDFGASADW